MIHKLILESQNRADQFDGEGKVPPSENQFENQAHNCAAYYKTFGFKKSSKVHTFGKFLSRQELNNFQLVYGLGNFHNFISSLTYHQNTRKERKRPPRSCTNLLMVRTTEVLMFLIIFDLLFNMPEKYHR